MILGATAGFLAQPVLTNILHEPPLRIRGEVVAGGIVLACVLVFAGRSFGRLNLSFYQFSKFASVGSLNFFIDVGILNLLMGVLGVYSGVLFILFKTLASIVAALNSFFWNKYWTFRTHGRPTIKEAAEFYGVSIVGGIINIAVASFIVNATQRPEAVSAPLWANIAAVTAIGASFLWNFFGYKNFVFRTKLPK